MSTADWLVFLMVGVLMLSLVVDAQPTVDDGESCQPTTLEEAVNSIRADIQLMPSCQALDETATARDVKLIKDDVTEVKNLLGSRQQSCSQCSAIDSSSLCKYKTHSRLGVVEKISDWGLLPI